MRFSKPRALHHGGPISQSRGIQTVLLHGWHQSTGNRFGGQCGNATNDLFSSDGFVRPSHARGSKIANCTRGRGFCGHTGETLGCTVECWCANHRRASQAFSWWQLLQASHQIKTREARKFAFARAILCKEKTSSHTSL